MNVKVILVIAICVFLFFHIFSCQNSDINNSIDSTTNEGDDAVLIPINVMDSSWDINADSLYDFRIFGDIIATCDEPSSHQENFINILPLNGCYIGHSSNIALENGALIDSTSLIWTTSALILANYILGDTSFWNSPFGSDHNNYLGFTYQKDQERYRGWIQIQIDTVTGETEFTNYHFNTCPDSSITAGYQ